MHLKLHVLFLAGILLGMMGCHDEYELPYATVELAVEVVPSADYTPLSLPLYSVRSRIDKSDGQSAIGALHESPD